MPLTVRPQRAILDILLSSLLAGDIVTDIHAISVLRQLCEGVASTQADLEYALYTLQQSFYLHTAEGLDLDIRGADHNLRRDQGQAASGTVTYTALLTTIDDIPLAAQQVVRAVLAEGTEVLYRSLGPLILTPSGRSISGQAPGTTLVSGTNDQVELNLDGDGPQTVVLGTQTTAVGIASALQAAVRALTAATPSRQSAYNGFRCDYSVTTPGAYTLRSGTPGTGSTCVVTPAAADDASMVLKLGAASGGIETPGQRTLEVPVVCDTIGVLGNVGVGQIREQASAVAGIEAVGNALMFANGREPASDDAYRQDLESYLLALGRGTEDALERAVSRTVSPDGQRHVMSSQVVYGASTIQVFVCDGQSLTVGAQGSVITAVQDELDGLGQEPGGWRPGGNKAGVASASILTVPVDVDVFVGETPDLISAQIAITQALYSFLYTANIGEALTRMRLDSVIDAASREVFNIVYRLPLAFTLPVPLPLGGGMGVKPMPGLVAVHLYRA